MRILHIMTLMSPKGEYGGPARVALNQLSELQARGHQVTLAASHRGYDSVPRYSDGIPLKLFAAHFPIPRIGFAGLAAPSMLVWLARHYREYDVVHVHLARDLVTLPAARLAIKLGLPVVAQTHGMIVESGRFAARPLDALLTKAVLQKAQIVLCLTPDEQRSIVSVSGACAITAMLNNGIKIQPLPSRRINTVPEVLFLARLQSRKRPAMFVEMADRLHRRGIRAQFRIVGPDEGEASVVQRMIDTSNADIRWEGPLSPSDTNARIAQCDVYVLPSINEPYPMSVIEAMSLGRPVVITNSCGLAEIVSETKSGIVTSENVDDIADAVAYLIENPSVSTLFGQRARETAANRLNISETVTHLEGRYRGVVAHNG